MKAEKYYDYYGFLCHRDQDKAFALKLQRKIENYRIPYRTRVENGFSTKYVRHIFLDNSDLKDSELKKDVLKNLSFSDNLLVICSRTSAAPVNGDREWADPEGVDWCDNPVKTGWIGFEIGNFMKKNPPDQPCAHIIPIVIDGDPSTGDCFHPILKKYINSGELRWFDFRNWGKCSLFRHKNGRRGELADIMIALLSPRDIKDFRRRDKIRRWWKTGIAAAALAFCATLFALGYDYFAPHSRRYQDYVLVEEIPVGLHELSGAERKEYSDYYRITTRKCDRTIKLEHLNQYGTPVQEESENHPYGPMIALYQCRDDGRPDVVEYLDRNGIVQTTYAYATDLKSVGFQENRYTSRQVYPVADINSYGIPNRMKIDKYFLDFDSHGRVQRRMYLSGVNYAVNGLGTAGERYEYDVEGRMTSIRFLDRNREEAANRNGIAGLNFGYGSDGILDRIEYVGADGGLEYGMDGYAYMERRISDGKRVTKYYNTDGNLTISNMGYAVSIETLDERMLPEEVSYYGLEGEKVYCADRFHAVSLSYNHHGDVASKEYRDENGGLVPCRDGYARIEMRCDRNGNVLREDYYGSDNHLVLMDHNACTVKRKFDRGYMVEEAYYGISGNGIYCKDGYFRKENKMDEQGKLKSSAFFGPDGEPVSCKEGYHKLVFQYDDRGNLEFVFVYGTQGQLIPYSGYWAKQEFKYNGGGYVTDVLYTDQFGQPVNIPGNYARIENDYDDSGRLKSTAYYGSDGELATECYQNDAGMQVGDRFFAKVEFAYDDEKNEVTTIYLDEKEEPTTAYPFSKKISQYDEVWNLMQESFYLPDESQPENYFNHIFYQYDSYGHVVRAEYDGPDNQPMATATKEGTAVHIAEISYDYRGNIKERKYFDTEGEETEHTVYEYDNNGLEISKEYLDPQGKSLLCKDGYSKMTTSYDKQGNEIEKAYFDRKGLTDTNGGYAICRQKFDENNVMTEICYLDHEEKPVNISEGYSCARQEVDRRRNVTEFVVLDKHDTELLTYQVEYNGAGQKIMEALYGPDGALFPHPDSGVALKKLFYDVYGNLKREEYYGEDHKPVLAFGVWAGWESTYNSGGQEIKRIYLGEDLKPKCTAEGFAMAEFSYDPYGREIQRRFLDEKGEETNCRFGFSRYDVEYIENNKIGSCVFRDADGNRLPEVEGEARMVELNLNGKDNIEYDGARYNKGTGEWGLGAIAHTVYHIYRLAFESVDGAYDLMLQPYIPLSPENQIAEYLNEIQKKYRLITGEKPIDLDTYGEEGRIFANILNEYTKALEEADAEKLMKGLMLDTLSEAVQLLSSQLEIEVTEEELSNFYMDFYRRELDGFCKKLSDDYGGFEIMYEAMDLQHYAKDTVEKTNDFYKMYGLSGIEIEDAAVMNVRFVVVCQEGEEVITDSFLFPTVQFMKMHGIWKMVMPDGFPRPSKGDVWEFLAQYAE